MILDGDENPLVVYQDATLQALLLRRRVANGEQESPWSRRVAISGDSDRDPGSFGFFASAQLVDGKLWITQYVYRHTTDEPTQGLAPEATVEMTELIRKLSKKYTILLIEHKMHIVMEISKIITVLNFGEKIEEGTPKQIKNSKKVQDAYLGRK